MKKRAPRFEGFTPASSEASDTKRAVRREGTRAELALRHALLELGLPFRINAHELPGKPDIVFDEARVVVFCDGDFWHGRRWAARAARLRHGHNPEYWLRKIASNIRRDRATTRFLQQSGWIVIRVWEGDLRTHLPRIQEYIGRVMRSRRGERKRARLQYRRRSR